MWLSDYSYLNDSAELIYGVDLIKKHFRLIGDIKDRDTGALLKRWGTSFKPSQCRAFIASFSRDDDSLSQWRAYGPIAVGFDFQVPAFGYSNSMHVVPVVYDQAGQETIVELLAEICACCYESDRAVMPEQVSSVYKNGEYHVVELAPLSTIRRSRMKMKCDLYMSSMNRCIDPYR